MTASLAPSRTEPHAEYRRQARRIRGAFAKAPAMRVRALRELAHRHDATQDAETRHARSSTVAAGSASSFAQVVRNRMDGPVLRYSHRTRLLREAARRGIGRFEANLVIAAVQHQAGIEREVEPVTSRSSWTPVVIGFAATQCAIVTGLWWLMA